MKAIQRRIEALETASGINGGWDFTKPCHTILIGEETPYTEALADYMAKHPDKAVAGDDNVIWIQLCSPKLDEQGSIIARDAATTEDHTSGPSLAEVLNDLEEA